MNAGRYLAICAATIAAMLAFVAAINYRVDIKGIYHTAANETYVQDYARRLVASPHGLRATPFDRALKLELARTVPAACYVLGSSHEMGIALDRMTGLTPECKSLVNLGVTGGSFEDTVMQLALLAKQAPTTALVGIGPWFFQTGVDERWTQFADDYFRARDTFGLPSQARPAQAAKLLNLINGDYLRRNLEQLVKGRALALPDVLEEAADGGNVADDEEIFRPDGSLTYSRAFQRNARVRDLSDCTDYRISLPYVQQPAADEFAQVVQRAGGMGVTVRLLLMPYHPGVWTCARHTAPALRAVEQTARTLADTLGVAVVGSYDARKFGLEPKDFYDEMHVDHAALSRIAPTR